MNKTLAICVVLILLALPSRAAQPSFMSTPVECKYTANEPLAEFRSHPDCADVISGEVVVKPEHLRRMSFSKQGLAAVWVNGQHYYIKPGGALLPVLSFDNGPDGFSEGLTRSMRGGKIAYFDFEFNQVIPPVYDWGWPFDDDRALVCVGCAAAAPDADGHVAITGGKWGFIDRQGVEVVPVRHSKEEVLKEH